ncbi:MAG: leucine-rich repeat domain-containing protein [Butyrivibrio sp.]|nr:leucine-rich repeat domain-containing protein [Butyrivibrio sp.]
MIKKIRIVLLLLVICIVLVFISSKLIFQKHWIGDYQVQIDKNLKTVYICGYRGDEEVVIPSEIGPFKVRYISADTFRDNKDIKSIFIPAGYDSVLQFIGCSNLRKIEFEEGISVVNVCVNGCPILKEIIIPEGVEIIEGWYVFCPMLSDIKFPSTLKKAGKHDFERTNLYEMHKNEKYYVVGDGVLLFFNGDYNQDIIIPKGIKCFNDYITKDETFQRKIYIPDTISILRTQVSDGDTFYFGDEVIDDLDLNCIDLGVEGTIVAPANSFIEQFCKENGYNFRVMTDEEEKTWRELTEAAASEITYQY